MDVTVFRVVLTNNHTHIPKVPEVLSRAFFIFDLHSLEKRDRPKEVTKKVDRSRVNQKESKQLMLEQVLITTSCKIISNVL